MPQLPQIVIAALSRSRPRSRIPGRPRGRIELHALAADGAAPNAEIDLYGDVDPWLEDGVSAKCLRKTLKDLAGAPVTLRLNSAGGDVFDGVAIYNDLREHGCPKVVITGLAGSIASLIAMAGDRVEIARNAFFMIHNSWADCSGDWQVFADMQAMLRQIDGQMAAVYAARTGLPPEEIAAMMDAETWLTAEEAVAKGFCDAIYGGALAGHEVTIAASAETHRFRKAPDVIKAAAPSSPIARRAPIAAAPVASALSPVASPLAPASRRPSGSAGAPRLSPVQASARSTDVSLRDDAPSLADLVALQSALRELRALSAHL